MRILVAEDNAFYRHMLVSTLNEWGYETVATVDGVEAWEKLRREDAPHLAILDWMMPGMEGTEVCRKLRTLHRPEPTYVIMLTSKLYFPQFPDGPLSKIPGKRGVLPNNAHFGGCRRARGIPPTLENPGKFAVRRQ